EGLIVFVVRGRLDPVKLQDGLLADHADGGVRDGLLLRSGVPSSGPVVHVMLGDREASEPRRRRDHRQGLRAGPQARGRRAVASHGRRPRGHAEQVRAGGRPAVTVARDEAAPRRVLFVTGRLAEPALRRTLAEMAPAFAYDVAVMKITVAALMTTPWIARFLAVPAGTDLVLIPGLCEGDPGVIAARAGGGMRVSVDSFDAGEIRTAVAAGAELVLSVNRSNLDVARDFTGTATRVVVIPDFGEGLETLEPSIAALERWGVSYLIDPVIEPIGFGFFNSLERFAEVRRRHPTAPLFMGIGNITELTAADTTGVNAVLIAIGEELGVRAVLTTEVIPWARGVVREVDIAR